MKKIACSLVLLYSTSLSTHAEIMEDKWWNDYKQSGQKIVPYVDSISESDPEASMWFLSTGGKYGFANRKGTEEEKTLMISSVKKVALGSQWYDLTQGKTLWDALKQKYTSSYKSVQRHVNSLYKIVDDLEKEKKSVIVEKNISSEYDLIDHDDEAFEDGKFSKSSVIKEENATSKAWSNVFSPSSYMQNIYDSFSYITSVGRKTSNKEVDSYLRDHYTALGYEISNDGINDYAFKTENGKTQVVSLWSLDDSGGERSKRFYSSFVKHLRSKFNDVSLHMPVQQQNEIKFMGKTLIENRGHWTYLNVSLGKNKHIAQLIDSTYWTAKLYDTKPIQDILGRDVIFETPDLRNDQGIFNHDDCGRFMLTYINANTSDIAKPKGSQIKRSFNQLKAEGFGLNKKEEKAENQGIFSKLSSWWNS